MRFGRKVYKEGYDIFIKLDDPKVRVKLASDVGNVGIRIMLDLLTVKLPSLWTEVELDHAFFLLVPSPGFILLPTFGTPERNAILRSPRTGRRYKA